MKRPLALGLVILIFFLGAFAGVVGTHVFYLRRVAEPGGLADLVLDVTGRRMAHRLDLRPAQRRQLDAILADTRDEIAAARGGFVADLRDIRARSAARLEAVLDEDQLRELQKIHREESSLIDRYLE